MVDETGFKMIKTEKDMEQLTFDGIEQLTIPLHRDCVHVSNRVLGLIAGKDKVLEQMGISMEDWKEKRRTVDLRLVSPPTVKGTPFMIIQIEEWWVEVLRRHVRQLIFDETDVHYVKTVLAAIPLRHGIQRITLKKIAKPMSFVPQMRCPEMAFVNCPLTVGDIKGLLAVDRPRLEHLFLEGLNVGKDVIVDGVNKGPDLKPLITLFIHYFERFINKKKDVDYDVAEDTTATFHVDVRCLLSDQLPVPEFLLPHNLFVTINGLLQEMDDPIEEQGSLSMDSEEEVVVSKAVKRFRKESSEEEEEEEEEKEKRSRKKSIEVGEEEDFPLFPLEEGFKAEEGGSEGTEESGADGVEEEEEEVLVLPVNKKKKEKKKVKEEEDQQWVALQHMFGDRVKSLNASDPFTKALAKAASKSRLVTCKTCSKSMAFRDLAGHKRSCKKDP